MAFLAPTAFVDALFLLLVLALAVDLGLATDVGAFAALVLALVVALPATCRPFEGAAGFAADLGLAADVEAFATLVLTLVLTLVVALLATCRLFEGDLTVVPLAFERLLGDALLTAAFVFRGLLMALPAFSGRISSGRAFCSSSVCATVCSGCPKA